MAVNLAGIFCAIHPATQNISPRYNLDFITGWFKLRPRSKIIERPVLLSLILTIIFHGNCLKIGSEKLYVLSEANLLFEMTKYTLDVMSD